MPARAHGCVHNDIAGANCQKFTHLPHEDGGVTSDGVAFHCHVPRSPKAGGLSLLLGDTPTPSAAGHDDCRYSAQPSLAYKREI